MSVSISPIYNEAQYFDNDGNPLSGGKIFQYEAGSFTVQQTSYSDESGNIANPNPIILDSSGRQPTTIYLTDGLAYNLVLTLPDGTTILDYKDFVVGVEPASSFNTGVELWNTLTETPTYVSGTSFLVAGNYATNFAIGNRVRITYTDTTTSFGTVSAVTFSSPNTQVTIVNDAGVLQSNMEFVAWSSLIVNGRTVDAGAVTYYGGSVSYPITGTVGFKLNSINADLNFLNTSLNALITRNTQQFLATDSGGLAYTTTVTPSPTSQLDPQVIYIVFATGNSGNPSTLNINGAGAYQLVQYNSAGTLVTATITAGFATAILWNGVSYTVLDRLPDPVITTPRGQQVFSSNGTFTVPAGVSSIKVTCVGGGGQGQLGTGDYSSFPPTETWGSGGGGGTTSTKYIAVTPAQTYSVSIGAGGANVSLGVGGSTSFGITTVIANGGNGSIGGTVGVGDVILAGGDGTTSLNATFGGGTQGGGQWPGGYGSGGSGALGANIGTVGGTGRNGLCIVEW